MNIFYRIFVIPNYNRNYKKIIGIRMRASMKQSALEISELFGMPIYRGDSIPMTQFPPFYASMFDAVDARIGESPCIFLEVKGGVKLKALLKAVAKIQDDLEAACVVVSPNLSSYQRRRLSEEGIAWLSHDDVFHIPFLGMASSRKPRFFGKTKMSPQAFRLMSEYLSGKFDGMSTQQVAKAIGKGLSVTNDYFIELNSFFPGIVGAKGRMKYLDPSMRQEIAEQIAKDDGSLPCFINEPQKRYYKTDVSISELFSEGFKRAGLTALSASTMIADAEWQTMAIGKREFRNTDVLSDATEVAEGDDPNLLVEIWPYEFDDRTEQDVYPLEIWLSLSMERKTDERIADALEEILGGSNDCGRI